MNLPLCILLHGFTGNPWEIEPLATALQESGYQVTTPLLPGHHHEKKRMEKATAEEWTRQVEKIVENAIAEEKQIHLIGFSMGAMIAAVIANNYQISTLVLLSPAVYVVTPNVWATKIKSFYQLARGNRKLLGAVIRKNIFSVRSAPPLTNVVQFQKIVRQAKKLVSSIQIPVCIIHGLKDELVDPRSSEWIYHAVPSLEKELHYLPESKHMICQDCEAEIVNQTVLSFLKKYQSAGASG